jgi:hypothetical protein
MRPGDTVQLALRITNHSPRQQMFRVAVRAPEGFRVTGVKPTRIASHKDGLLKMTVQVPRDCPAGLQPLVADVAWEGTGLREWSEVVIEVAP